MVLLTQLLLARRVRLVALVALPLLLVRMSAFAAPIVWNDPVNISNNVNPVAEDGCAQRVLVAPRLYAARRCGSVPGPD